MKKDEYIEYEDGTRVLLDEDDAPELTDEWFANAKYGVDGLAELVGESSVSTLRERGRPRKADPKQAIKLRLDADIISRFRETGKGWHTRINAALREWLDEHPA